MVVKKWGLWIQEVWGTCHVSQILYKYYKGDRVAEDNSKFKFVAGDIFLMNIWETLIPNRFNRDYISAHSVPCLFLYMFFCIFAVIWGMFKRSSYPWTYSFHFEWKVWSLRAGAEDPESGENPKEQCWNCHWPCGPRQVLQCMISFCLSARLSISSIIIVQWSLIPYRRLACEKKW